MDQLTPQKSLLLIAEAIDDARIRAYENGFNFIFWGTLMAVSAGAHQFLVLRHHPYPTMPYMVLPFGMIVSGIYWRRKLSKRSRNLLNGVLNLVGLVVGANCFVAGFIHHDAFQRFLPIALLLFSIQLWVTSAVLRFRALRWVALFMNILAYAALYVPEEWQPSIMVAAATGGMMAAGVMVRRFHHRKL